MPRKSSPSNEPRAIEAEQLRRALAVQQAREQMITAITKRSKPAGEAAKQCYVCMGNDNIETARVHFNRVRQLDGGIPILMQEDFGRASARLVEPLKIA